MKKAYLAGMLAGGALAAMPAQAGHYLGTYAATDNSGFTANLDITTSDTLNAVGGYDITAISGTAAGSAINDLFPNPNQPNSILTLDGLFAYDQVYFTSGFASLYGYMFGTASGIEYNLYANGDGSFTLAGGVDGNYVNVSTGTFSAAPAPEAATWAMMVGGFGMVGFAMRARRKAAVSFA